MPVAKTRKGSDGDMGNFPLAPILTISAAISTLTSAYLQKRRTGTLIGPRKIKLGFEFLPKRKDHPYRLILRIHGIGVLGKAPTIGGAIRAALALLADDFPLQVR